MSRRRLTEKIGRRALGVGCWVLALLVFATPYAPHPVPQSVSGAGTISGAGTAKAAAGGSTARHFTGTSSDYLARADNASLRPSTAITFACWLRYTSASQNNYAHPIHKNNGGLADSFQFCQYSNTYGNLYTDLNYGAVSAIASASLSQGLWYFVVGRWVANGYLNLDIYNADGTLFNHASSASTFAGPINYSDNPLYIGNDGSLAYGFIGDIAQVYIDNTSLSDADVQTLLHGTQPHSASAGYWPLGLGSPDPDQSGNGNDLTVNGTTIVPGP